MDDLNSMPAAPRSGADISSEELVRTFCELGPKLLNTLLCLLGNYADAQDAVQNAFLKCWRARASTAGVRDVRAWIFRVGINAARDARRSAWRRRSKPLEENASLHISAEPSPARLAEDNEKLRLLDHAISQLRVEERAVFLLRQNDLLPYDEIARLRNSPIGTVKTQMRRALAKLRVALRRVQM
jgi:RNA polymerase sigma-70 factor (ECF subfamily)